MAHLGVSLLLQASSHLVPLLLQESSHLVPLLLQESSIYFLSFLFSLLYSIMFSSGNIKQKNVFSQLIFQQNKDEQRMGNAIFSSGEFFVV